MLGVAAVLMRAFYICRQNEQLRASHKKFFEIHLVKNSGISSGGENSNCSILKSPLLKNILHLEE